MPARCGARTRSGGSCGKAPAAGKRRCRLHGGATGSGAPRGNSNALIHGAETREARAHRSAARRLIRLSRATLRIMEESC
ncbi:MAG: HGGxSTG domain-containing protein [Dongiaceae bacterium]